MRGTNLSIDFRFLQHTFANPETNTFPDFFNIDLELLWQLVSWDTFVIFIIK